MIFAVDVQYDEAQGTAKAGGVFFEAWGSASGVAERVMPFSGIAEYVPGEFYRRELPCILGLLGGERPDVIVVDGYVDLGQKPGLGRHLYEALNAQIAVVGVAKSRFRSATAHELLRGGSSRPLFITAAGLSLADAVAGIGAMQGEHRLPELLKRVDHLARGWVEPMRPTP